jgi:hypothetical protein
MGYKNPKDFDTVVIIDTYIILRKAVTLMLGSHFDLRHGRFGVMVSALDLNSGDPGSNLGVAHETNA